MCLSGGPWQTNQLPEGYPAEPAATTAAAMYAATQAPPPLPPIEVPPLHHHYRSYHPPHHHHHHHHQANSSHSYHNQVWVWPYNMQHSSGGGGSGVSPQSLPPSATPPSYETASMMASHSQAVTQATVVTATAQVQEAHSTSNHIAAHQAVVTSSQLQEVAETAIENDKRAIYRHPLFPLMALLFEKCEQATQTPDCPSSDSFDVDIQAFVHHQEQDRKPFFSDDPDLDNLMVKAIQVLRIHLLELEKVNELCKDFCNRYITCLKGKLQSENLLRTEGMNSLDLNLDSPTGGSSVVLQQQQQQQQQQASSQALASLGQGQIVSGGTVYQMVQTPQGLVAQPIQLQSTVQTSNSSQVIHGSTPLSQIGVPTTPNSGQTNTTMSSPVLMNSPPLNIPSDEDDYMGKKKNKRGVLPKQATQVMKSWLFQHIVHPYPTEDEKRQIAQQTNLSLLQVNNWFINARRRILQPMLDASNPEQTKAKKSKPQNRPVQRFWPDNLANMQPPSSSTAAETERTTREAEDDGNDGDEELEEEDEDPEGGGGGGGGSVADQTSNSQPTPIVLPPGTIMTADGRLLAGEGGRVIGQVQGGQVIVQNGSESQGGSLPVMDLTLNDSDSSGMVD